LLQVVGEKEDLLHCTLITVKIIMAAVVAISLPTPFVDASAARKRRREILASQRQLLDVPALVNALDVDPIEAEHAVKKSKVTSGTNVFPTVPTSSADVASPMETLSVADLAASTSATFAADAATSSATSIAAATAAVAAIVANKRMMNSKKPQMKYDPEVPMTKEEAAVWRREQRRKRNRESAAMSRQRQRDRIVDLEIEVDEWKIKVGSIMDRIKKLEDASGIDSRSLVPELDLVPDQSLELELIHHNTSTFVSPPSSPGRYSPVSPSPEASPIASSCIKSVISAVVDQVLGGIGDELEHSDKMISRHAAS
jgi:hypothetical protein